MYTVKKRIEVSASHSLKLSYESKCQNLHGHNWIIIPHKEQHHRTAYAGNHHSRGSNNSHRKQLDNRPEAEA